jgi:hypothetical protein
VNQGATGLSVAQLAIAVITVTVLVMGTTVGGVAWLFKKLEDIRTLISSEVNGLKLASAKAETTIERVMLPKQVEHTERLDDHERRLTAVELGDALNTLIEVAKVHREKHTR